MPTEAVLLQRVERTVAAELTKVLPQIINNSIRRAIRTQDSHPNEGTKCRSVWNELDKMTKEAGHAPTLQEILGVARTKRWNANNTRTEYYHWRRANGIYGRLATLN